MGNPEGRDHQEKARDGDLERRKAGIHESVIMAINGHSTREMFDRYNTIDGDDTRQAVDQMGVFLGGADQSADQATKPKKSKSRRTK